MITKKRFASGIPSIDAPGQSDCDNQEGADVLCSILVMRKVLDLKKYLPNHCDGQAALTDFQLSRRRDGDRTRDFPASRCSDQLSYTPRQTRNYFVRNTLTMVSFSY